MQAVECNRYEDIDGPMEQHYQEYINVFQDFNKPSNRIQDKKAEGSTVKCWKIAMALFCILFFAAFGGVTAIFVLHYESQGMWNQGYLELDSKFQQLQQKYSNEYLDLKQNYERLEEKTALLEENSHNVTLEIRNEVEQMNRIADIDRNETANALKALNVSTGNNLYRLNADISDIKRRQDDESTYIDPVLVKWFGWQRSDNLVFKYFPDAVDYGTAHARCSVYPSGRLAAKVIRNSQAVRNIYSMGFSRRVDYRSQPWIGYDDLVVEGTYKWIDGGMTNPATTAWSPGQPNNYDGNQDCVIISSSYPNKLHLNDFACSEKFSYMCEIDI